MGVSRKVKSFGCSGKVKQEINIQLAREESVYTHEHTRTRASVFPYIWVNAKKCKEINITKVLRPPFSLSAGLLSGGKICSYLLYPLWKEEKKRFLNITFLLNQMSNLPSWNSKIKNFRLKALPKLSNCWRDYFQFWLLRLVYFLVMNCATVMYVLSFGLNDFCHRVGKYVCTNVHFL